MGSFLSSPQKIGEDIRLVYTNGSFCINKKTRIQTVLTLKCKPGRLHGDDMINIWCGCVAASYTVLLLAGNLESAPVLRSASSDGCVYELEWYTAAACVLAKTQGDDCKVEDPQAGTHKRVMASETEVINMSHKRIKSLLVIVFKMVYHFLRALRYKAATNYYFCSLD